MQEPTKLIILALLGIAAGFLNVTAGGGSLLTLPFLIFLGLPAPIANGTNRIAILVQNIFATTRFHQFKVIPGGVTLTTGIPAVIGSILGAQLAVDIDELLFKRILAVIMVIVIGLMFLKPGHNLQASPIINKNKKIILAISFFGIGIYGGFIQGGIGFLIITVLSLIGYDLVRTNALKVLVVLFFTPFALLVFILHDEVNFLLGVVLAAGNAVGAWLASRVVVERGHNFIRWIVVIAVIGFAVKLFLG